MKLYKNLAALCLAALMVFGVGSSFLPDVLDTAVTAEAATKSDYYFAIWYKVGSGPDDDDLETVYKYYDEDDLPVKILEPDDVWDDDDYDGWTFRYWKSNIDVDGDGDDEDRVDPGETMDADEDDVLKLTAVWREGDDDDDDGDYEITYKIGEAGDAKDVVKYTDDGDFTAPKVSKIFDSDDYDGWDFDCWKVARGDSDYKGEYYDAGDTIPEEAFNDDDEITLTAQWDENDDVCVVKYSSGNSSATGTTPTTKSVDYGDSITLPSNPYTLTGYTFAGWDVNGTVKKAGDTVTVKDDLTIKATWTAVANVTLTYSPGKGTGTAYTKTYSAGTTVKLEANSFTRDGYTFAGWWIASVSKTLAAGTSVTINGNDSATAQWTAIVTSQPAVSQPAASQPAASAPELSEAESSEAEPSSEAEESESESEPEEETENTLSYTISGETPVSGISAVLDDDIGNAQLWVTAINGSNAADNTTAALIDSGDAVAAFDLSLLVDGSTYAEPVSGTISFAMQGSMAVPSSSYGEAALALIHVTTLDEFTGKGYYMPDGKKALYFDSESGEKSEAAFFGFETENDVSRIIIKDNTEVPNTFAYLSEAGTIVEVQLIPNADADTFDIDFTSLSPFLITYLEINEAASSGLPLWVWIAIGGALIFIILIVVLLAVRGKNAKEEQKAAERLTRREPYPEKAMAKEAPAPAPHFYNDEGFDRASNFDAKKGFDVATSGENDENYSNWNNLLNKK